MIRGQATIAIVRTRLGRELPALCFSVAACALLAYVQRYDDAAARIAGCMLFATLTGIASALLTRGFGRHRELDLCEQSAPLFGRELARATALVPCLIATAAVAAFWSAGAFYARPDLAGIAVSEVAACAAALTALCATVRSGLLRALYVVLAACIAVTGFALMQTATGTLAIAFCAVAGFIALRQYGEALARYDPV